MTTSFDSVATLSEQELLDHFAGLVARDRRTTAELLVAIAEIDERRLWASHACPSMFTFCMERFHMSEQVTAKRIWAARTARRFPVVLEMVARGDLHLGAVHLLAKHLTAENHEQVLERARHKSSREVERLVAELAPQADVASRIRALPGPRGERTLLRAVSAAIDGRSPVESDESSMNGKQAGGDSDRPTAERAVGDRSNDRRSPATVGAGPAAKSVVPLSPRRYKIEITVDEATHDKLRSLQDLLACSATGRDPAAIVSRAIEVLLDRTLSRKAGCTDRPRPTEKTTPANATAADPAAHAADAPSSDRPDPRKRAAYGTSSRRARSRHIPAAVRREVWQRDCGRCCYVDARGRRCSESSRMEFHHRKPFAMGGPPTPENIELRCAAHNQYQADLDFGRSLMDAKRGKVGAAERGSRPGSGGAGRSGARAFPGECYGDSGAP